MARLAVPSHSKKVIADLLTAADLFPPEARNIHNAHDPRAIPSLVQEETLQLVLVDVLIPVMRSRRNNSQKVLRNQVRREPAHPRPRNGAHDQPAAGLHKRPDSFQEGPWLVDMLNNLEQTDNVVGIAGLPRHLKVFNGALLVEELAAQRRVFLRVRLCNGQDGRRRVNGGDSLRRS